tara:strand:- start:170 stop:607 length:438 start_codon:yes stop_codon:yes gene_type:complete
MSLNYPKPGANHVPSFQISGLPYVTRSAAAEVTATPLQINLPYVTRFFIVGNPGPGDLRVGFTQNGVEAAETANYFTVKPFSSGTLRYEVRCKELWFRRDGNDNTAFELFAGLTNIDDSQFPTLTGSLITTGFGAPTTSSWPGVG